MRVAPEGLTVSRPDTTLVSSAKVSGFSGAANLDTTLVSCVGKEIY